MKTFLVFAGICILVAVFGAITSGVLLFWFKTYPALTGTIHFVSGFWGGSLYHALTTKYL